MPICTITKAGRFDEYGRPLNVGAQYNCTLDQMRSLIQAGFTIANNLEAESDEGSSVEAPRASRVFQT
jgi:hypothetical protein